MTTHEDGTAAENDEDELHRDEEAAAMASAAPPADGGAESEQVETEWSGVERQAEPAEVLAMTTAAPPGAEAGGWVADPGLYEERWTAIQTGFVDEPSQAVESADQLVAQVVDEITAAIALERESISSSWRQAGEVSTEDLRQVFQRYRSLFHDLVAPQR